MFPPNFSMKVTFPARFALMGLLVLSQSLGAQLFKRLTVENGLSGNFVKSIHKDPKGFVWLGTLEGIDRFDGAEIRNFSWWFTGNGQSVNCFADDSNSRLWLGTDKGVYRVLPDLTGVARFDLGVGDVQVLSLMSGGEKLWAGTNRGLFELDPERNVVRHYSLGDRDIGVTSMVGASNGILWLSTSLGLCAFDTELHIPAFYDLEHTALPQANALSSLAIAGEKIYAGTVSHGVYEFDISTKRIAKLTDIGDDYILTLYAGTDHLLYIGTDAGGVKVFDPAAKRVVAALVHDPNNVTSISSNSVYSFLKDESGRYWVGTYSGGVNYSAAANSMFKVVQNVGTHSFVNKSVRSLYFHRTGHRFIGTRNGFYVEDARGHTTLYDKGNSPRLRGDIVLTFYPFGDDILIGTYGGGACRFNLRTGKIEALQGHPEFENGCIYAFETDGDGNLWACTLNGIIRIEKNTQRATLYNTGNTAIKSDLVYAIRFDRENRLWVGTMSGTSCFRLAGGLLEPVKTAIELPRFKTVGFYLDSENSMWIATEKGGAYVVDSGMSHIRLISEKEGLSNNSVSGIIQTGKNHYWLTTLKGLARYDNASGTIRHFGVSSGLPGLVFSPNAIVRDEWGKVWLGNEKGLVVFDPKTTTDTEVSFKPVLTDVYVGGKSYLTPTGDQKGSGFPKIDFEGTQRDIGFRFVALNYNDPVDNRYAYRLVGEKKEWSQLDGKNAIYFQELKAGSYRFEVALLDESGGINARDITAVDFQIHPMWYENKLLLVVLFLLLIVLFFAIRFKLSRMKQKLLAIEEEMRHHQPEEPKERYESSRLSEERGQELVDALLGHINQDHAFLNPDLKIGDLADRLDCSVHELSQVINQHLGQSFSEFINHYRIEEVKRRLQSDEYSRFTLLAIAESCGFNSKTSFYRVFKKETGMTPAEYLLGLQRKRENGEEEES
ncbi:MAG: two-component regulator propeller domain-containing protein [Breznakibacter sp.]